MALAAVVAICISVVIGSLVSRMLTKPIHRITSTAKQIRDGDLSARTGLRGDDEIDQLGETFDEMATSLEKDMKHEKRLTSDVAHELRTPLMAMLATVEAMQDGVYPTDDEHLETVASETRRLARLVQQMLDLSRMENSTFSSSVSASVPASDTPSASVTSNAGAPVCARINSAAASQHRPRPSSRPSENHS